tara:strand:- start:126 stop:1220 length:1095 start_codon:yes stop_codon:yes gene_type:complete
MKRRDLLKGAAATSTAVAATSLPSPAISKGLKELRMVTTWPKMYPGLGTSADRLAKRISQASGGKIRVNIFAAGELVPPFEAFNAVSSGEVDIYHAFEYYWQSKSKAFNFFAAIPFGITATEMDAWIYFNGGQSLWDELSAEFNIKPLLAGNTGMQMGGWYTREINGPADFRGLRFRMPGIGGEVLRQMGAAAVALAGGEIFPALQSGALDGTEWVGPWNDLAFGFYRVVQNYYYPGFHEPGTAIAVGINKRLWDGLTESERRLIESACLAENNLTLAEFNTNNAAALKTLVNEHDVQLRRFPNSVLNEIGRLSGEVVAEIGNSDPVTKRVYESFLRSRKDSIGWSRISDQSFWSARLLPFKYG